MTNPIVTNLDGSNPGPAGISTLNTQLIVGAQNMPNYGSGVGQATNGLRLLAVGRGINISTTGDVAVLPLINTQAFGFEPTATGIVCANPLYLSNGVLTPGTAAATVMQLWSGPSGTGTSICASTTLSSLTGATGAASIQYVTSTGTGYYQAASWGVGATSGNGGAASNSIYIHVTTKSATATQMDIFIYGFDLT